MPFPLLSQLEASVRIALVDLQVELSSRETISVEIAKALEETRKQKEELQLQVSLWASCGWVKAGWPGLAWPGAAGFLLGKENHGSWLSVKEIFRESTVGVSVAQIGLGCLCLQVNFSFSFLAFRS